MDDSAFDYAALYKEREEQRQLRRAEWEFGLISDEEYWAEEGGAPWPMAYSYAPEDLWLEITGVTNNYAYLTLHGTVDTNYYQLQSKTNLVQPGGWTLSQPLSEPRLGDSGANQTIFPPVNIGDNTNMFFRAQRGEALVTIGFGPDAYEPNAALSGQSGSFTINAYLNSQDLAVYYRVSGMASNGGDYTYRTGLITMPPGSTGSPNLFIQPIADSLVEGSETVIVTLVQTNSYLIYPTYQTASILIKDSSTKVRVQADIPATAIEPDGPPGAPAESGSFQFTRGDDLGQLPPLTVIYSLSGSASNGVDYTNLTGTLTFDDQNQYASLTIAPLPDSHIEELEKVTLTVLPTNTYLIEQDLGSDTITIADTSTTVSISHQEDAIEPNPKGIAPSHTGIFSISRRDTRFESRALTVSYQISGTATNDVDYTNLTGTVTLQANQISTNIFIEPKFDDQLENDESVTLTLTTIGDGYQIHPDFAAATIWITNNLATNTFQRVVELYKPSGIDFHGPLNALIVSTNYNSGQPFNFARIYTNTVSSNIVTVVTNWSGVHEVLDEVKLLTVKSTGNGFTNGDIYFGSGNAIGWVSANGTQSNLTWCALTNAVQPEAMPVRGSLCMDNTGIFSNHIIAVTSYGDPDFSRLKGVWRVDANGNRTLLANIDTPHLEGVIVLTNDPAKWGPWAGKIITGDEGVGAIFAIDPNGAVTNFDTLNIISGGIHTEDFEIIPPNQDLYACDLFGNVLVKLSRNHLTNHVGELLITQAGEYDPPGKLFIVHWDATITNFAAIRVPYIRPDNSVGLFEHVTFAPIDLPPFDP